jgi:hypothetical protein
MYICKSMVKCWAISIYSKSYEAILKRRPLPKAASSRPSPGQFLGRKYRPAKPIKRHAIGTPTYQHSIFKPVRRNSCKSRWVTERSKGLLGSGIWPKYHGRQVAPFGDCLPLRASAATKRLDPSRRLDS